jgi:hypothetical protein
LKQVDPRPSHSSKIKKSPQIEIKFLPSISA